MEEAFNKLVLNSNSSLQKRKTLFSTSDKKNPFSTSINNVNNKKFPN